MPKEGYAQTNLAPNQATVMGSFDTNSTSAPDGIRGKFDVVRTGVGVFRLSKTLDTRLAPAATYTQWEYYDVTISGAAASNYVVKITGEDGNDAQPYVDITVFIRTYGAGVIDTYVAAETTDLKISFYGVLLAATAF